ncbi:MAG: hypothetical protein J6386_13485 [Candidatus Synoicihabitans palmerolidicus]|nr:hypothetical protein [Candidatus Synoicihabitans palmerolidicus]
MGRPWLADVEVAFFYPLNIVFLAGPGMGLLLAVAVHLALALCGVRGLMRGQDIGAAGAWFAALGFVLGAPLLGRLQCGQIQVFCALCWMPMVLALAERVMRERHRRSAVRLAGGLAMSFLAGSPPMFWLTGWAMVGYVGLLGLTRTLPATVPAGRSWWWAVGALGLAMGLVSVQAWPFLELVRQGNRGGNSARYALENAMAARVGGRWGRPVRAGSTFIGNTICMAGYWWPYWRDFRRCWGEPGVYLFGGYWQGDSGY